MKDPVGRRIDNTRTWIAPLFRGSRGRDRPQLPWTNPEREDWFTSRNETVSTRKKDITLNGGKRKGLFVYLLEFLETSQKSDGEAPKKRPPLSKERRSRQITFSSQPHCLYPPLLFGTSILSGKGTLGTSERLRDPPPSREWNSALHHGSSYHRDLLSSFRDTSQTTVSNVCRVIIICRRGSELKEYPFYSCRSQ